MYKDLVDVKGEYNTPKYLFNYLNKHFKFELDPCDSGNKWLGLPYNYMKEDNGLIQEWKHNAFVNPPYGMEYETKWLDKCIKAYKAYDTINFILLPAKTEALWFSKAMEEASVIIFPQGRISFIKDGKPMNGNTMGSILFGFMDTGGYILSEAGKQRLEFLNENRELNITEKIEDSYIFFPDKNTLVKNYS